MGMKRNGGFLIPTLTSKQDVELFNRTNGPLHTRAGLDSLTATKGLEAKFTVPGDFLALDHAIMDTVAEIVRALDGSFSAEHGIGQLKPYMMEDWRGGAELMMMRKLKRALDPSGLLNPGKVLPPS